MSVGVGHLCHLAASFILAQRVKAVSQIAADHQFLPLDCDSPAESAVIRTEAPGRPVHEVGEKYAGHQQHLRADALGEATKDTSNWLGTPCPSS